MWGTDKSPVWIKQGWEQVRQTKRQVDDADNMDSSRVVCLIFCFAVKRCDSTQSVSHNSKPAYRCAEWNLELEEVLQSSTSIRLEKYYTEKGEKKRKKNVFLEYKLRVNSII